MSILPLPFTEDHLLHESKEIKELFQKYFREALYDRKERSTLKVEEHTKYQELMKKFNEIVRRLLIHKETKQLGFELESLLASLIMFVSNEYYENGIRDGYIFAELLKGNKFL